MLPLVRVVQEQALAEEEKDVGQARGQMPVEPLVDGAVQEQLLPQGFDRAAPQAFDQAAPQAIESATGRQHAAKAECQLLEPWHALDLLTALVAGTRCELYHDEPLGVLEAPPLGVQVGWPS